MPRRTSLCPGVEMLDSIQVVDYEMSAASLPIHRFSVADYEELGRLGILTEDDNVELLDGLIVQKTTKHPPHDGTIDLIVHLLQQHLPRAWYARIQNVVETADSMPEPDIAIVRGTPGDFRRRHPQGGDVGLIVEVADATAQRDRAKAAIYARAGIPHYWIVNLDDLQMEVFSQPRGKGRRKVYQDGRILRGSEAQMIVLDGKKAGSLRVRDILPPG